MTRVLVDASALAALLENAGYEPRLRQLLAAVQASVRAYENPNTAVENPVFQPSLEDNQDRADALKIPLPNIVEEC